jgi:predicted porin
MKKRPKRAAVLALAGGALALPAAAQEAGGSTVTIYGRLNTAVEHVRASGAGPDLSATRLSNYRSVLGFRGQEDLGAGLRAIWQIESAVSLDTGGGTLAGRDTRVGLAGAWGTLFAGTWTLPYTAATSGFDPFYPTTAGYMSLMGNGSAPSTDNVIDTSSFDRRQRNQVQYWSPAWRGLSARLAYGLSEERPANGAKPSLLSGSVAWEAGDLTLTAAHERHRAYQAVDTTDTASKLGAAYRLGPARLAAVVERLRYETATGTLQRNAWYLSAALRLGAGSLRAGYTRAGDGRGSAQETVGFFRSGADTGASQWTVGYEVELSKRTAVHAYASRIRNDAAAVYDFAINELGIAAGQRPSVLALGMRHQF